MGRTPCWNMGVEREKEGAAETAPEHDEHAQRVYNPHSLSLCATGRVKGVQIRNEAEPVKKEWLAGGMCFRSWFYFSLPYSAVFGNKVIFPN